jgi:hypothetical protein
MTSFAYRSSSELFYDRQKVVFTKYVLCGGYEQLISNGVRFKPAFARKR